MVSLNPDAPDPHANIGDMFYSLMEDMSEQIEEMETALFGHVLMAKQLAAKHSMDLHEEVDKFNRAVRSAGGTFQLRIEHE